jgi:PAS domain-containing protein
MIDQPARRARPSATSVEEKLREQGRLFDTAVNNMPQGLIMFDAAERLLVCNRRYLEMYSLSSETVKPGCTLVDMLQQRIAKGTFARDPLEYRTDLLATMNKGGTSRRVAETGDGRTIAVVTQPMEGGGWVATHEDVTEHRRLERQTAEQAEQLRRQEENLRIQNLRFKAALDNIGDGLDMFDTDERLVLCNDRFGSIYNLPPDLLKVGTPYREIVTYRIKTGVLAGDTSDLAVEQKIEALNRLPRDTLISRIEELADGRLIRVTRQPLEGGGWVGTHEDVTDRHRNEARISFMAHHDLLTGLTLCGLHAGPRQVQKCQRHTRTPGGRSIA